MEIYKIIEGFENYEVSSLGNIRNILTGKVYKFDTINPYCTVYLENGNDKKLETVHTLVAKAFIPNPDNKRCVDHIDNDKTNNNVNNLRWGTSAENSCNRPIPKNNTSGFKGVYYDKRLNKWTAKIGHNNKLINLGFFKTKEEALEKRLQAVVKYQGDFANNCEKDLIINLNIKKTTKRNIIINLNIEDEDEEYKKLEQELEDIINSK